MLMRYHWGLGVGHIYTYAHTQSQTNAATAEGHSGQFEGAVGDDGHEGSLVALISDPTADSDNLHQTLAECDSPDFDKAMDVCDDIDDSYWVDNPEDPYDDAMPYSSGDDELAVDMDDMYGSP
jgi:hypothetical protein